MCYKSGTFNLQYRHSVLYRLHFSMYYFQSYPRNIGFTDVVCLKPSTQTHKPSGLWQASMAAEMIANVRPLWRCYSASLSVVTQSYVWTQLNTASVHIDKTPEQRAIRKIGKLIRPGLSWEEWVGWSWVRKWRRYLVTLHYQQCNTLGYAQAIILFHIERLSPEVLSDFIKQWRI